MFITVIWKITHNEQGLLQFGNLKNNQAGDEADNEQLSFS